MNTNGSLSPSTAWRSVLVAIDEFLGPYPALVPADQVGGRPFTPRFRLQVVERLQVATVVLAAGNGRIVRVDDGQVWQVDLRAGQAIGKHQVLPDADGLYAIDAPAGQWAVVEILRERHGGCECGTCSCPPVCAVCDEPIGGGHATGCVWPYGSARWERPAIAGVAAVLDAHRHRPGCPFVRRRPGPLFDRPGLRCCFCGDHGTRLSCQRSRNSPS